MCRPLDVTRGDYYSHLIKAVDYYHVELIEAVQELAKASDQAYVKDIRYIWTQEGWLYLVTIINLYSRRVVGWSMCSRIAAQLVCDALRMAIWQRRSKAGLIVHSDRERNYEMRYEAQQDVMNYITMWHSSHRLHSYLGYKLPNQFKMEMQIPRLELQKSS
jgi:transposase InsO family protein